MFSRHRLAGKARIAAFVVLAAAFSSLVTGCASPRAQFTALQAAVAEPAGLANVRTAANASSEEFAAVFGEITLRQRAPLSYLAVSGGGAAGAFGAGVLAGWTVRGDRPTFDIVSGVSTGALIAPFAYLGAEYDPVLETIYTDGFGERLIDDLNLLRVLGGGAISQERLRRSIDPFVDRALLEAIAREYARGRFLIVGTTNLDTGEAMLWNMGAIAAADTSGSLELFRSVLAASASVPVAFEPALIEAVAEGRLISEMHVDGAASQPLITIPRSLMLTYGRSGTAVATDIYLIVNNKLQADFEFVEGGIFDIASQSVGTMIRSAEQSEVFSIYTYARNNGIGYHVAAIETGIPVPDDPREQYDTSYMRSLFAYGFERAQAGKAFDSEPVFVSAATEGSPPRPRTLADIE